MSHKKGVVRDCVKSVRILPASKVLLYTSCFMEVLMEIILFFVVWLGGAVLHTLFDHKVKPVLQALKEESDMP